VPFTLSWCFNKFYYSLYCLTLTNLNSRTNPLLVRASTNTWGQNSINERPSSTMDTPIVVPPMIVVPPSTTTDTLRQLRQDAAAATAAAAAVPRGEERLRLVGVVLDLRKREVAACEEQRARLESGAALESVEETGAAILEQSIAAAGAASAWLLLAEDAPGPAPMAECRDRARGWLEEAEYHVFEAFFHDFTLAYTPAALAARDAILSVKRELD
jgi:hypothetical protein